MNMQFTMGLQTKWLVQFAERTTFLTGLYQNEEKHIERASVSMHYRENVLHFGNVFKAEIKNNHICLIGHF